MAAEGLYREAKEIACVCVTSGPGVQNMLNGYCGCWYDSIPGLYITGAVNTTESLETLKTCQPRQRGFQEMPVIRVFDKVSTAHHLPSNGRREG